VGELVEAIDSVETAAQDRMRELFNQAIDEVEMTLMTEKPDLVISLRRMRGLSPPATETSKQIAKETETGEEIVPSEQFVDQEEAGPPNFSR